MIFSLFNRAFRKTAPTRNCTHPTPEPEYCHASEIRAIVSLPGPKRGRRC
jgi:hypothetical protein